MDVVKPNDVIVVWFSCGAASAVAAYKTKERYKDIATIRIVNNFILEEHPDNRRFLNDVSQWLEIPIELAINKRFPSCSTVEVWNKKRFMSSPFGAPCTFELKKLARQQFEKENKIDWHVLGFTYEEKHRSDKFILGERSNLLPVLIEEKITKKDCFRIIRNAGIELPEIYKLGYPNANCIGCVKSASPTYWNHVRKMHPDIFESRAVQSRSIGARLVIVKNKRIFLDELDPNVRGRSMKNLDFECGIFCEER